MTPYRELDPPAASELPPSELVVAVEESMGALGAILAAVGLGRRASRCVVLRVDRGGLELRLPKSRAPAHVALSSLVDVGLDTKHIQRMLEGGSPVPAVRFSESRAGPETEVARIRLSFDDGTSIALTDTYVAHMVATEWMGKIRVFLRRHGWIPHDERPAEDDT